MMLAASAAGTTVYTVVGIIGGLFGIVALLGAAAAVFTSRRAEKTIELLSVSNETLDRDNTRLTAQVTALSVQVEALTRDNERLTELVGAEAAIRELEAKMDGNHRETVRLLKAKS